MTNIKRNTLASGQEVYEAHCPYDTTMLPRLPVPENHLVKEREKANEPSKVADIEFVDPIDALIEQDEE